MRRRARGLKAKNNSRNAAGYDAEAVQKFFDYDARRAPAEIASSTLTWGRFSSPTHDDPAVDQNQPLGLLS